MAVQDGRFAVYFPLIPFWRSGETMGATYQMIAI
jgi:hypothetical protein